MIKKQIKKAFTLVEILIVVVIIGILMMALMWWWVFFSADSTVQNKLQATSASWRKCVQDLDTIWVSIDDAKSVVWKLLVDNESLDENWNTLTDMRIVSKWKLINSENWYKVEDFHNTIKDLIWVDNIDQTVCQDFIANFIQDVSQKWTTVNWYIPAWIDWDWLFNYIDTDFWWFLVCATHKSSKYAYFKDANKWNKFYTCAILWLNWDNAWEKIRVITAFGWDWKKVMKTDETTPEIPTR